MMRKVAQPRIRFALFRNIRISMHEIAIRQIMDMHFNNRAPVQGCLELAV